MAGPGTPGPTFGPFELLDRLAQGPADEVWLARRLESASMLVVKLLEKPLAGDPEVVARFLDAGRGLQSLSHPNLARVEGLGTVDGRPWVAMELVEGFSLERLLSESNEAHVQVPLGLVARIGSELCAALAFLEEKVGATGGARQGPTPDNVLVSFGGEVKLVDPTATRAARPPGAIRAGSDAHRLAYVAPEQVLESGQPDGRAELFSLGAVLHELCTGKPTFERATAQATLDAVRFDSPPALPSRVVRPMWEVIEQALEKSPTRRYQDAGAMRKGLDAFLASPAYAAGPADLARFLAALPGAPAPGSCSEAQAGAVASKRARPVAGRLLGGLQRIPRRARIPVAAALGLAAAVATLGLWPARKAPVPQAPNEPGATAPGLAAPPQATPVEPAGPEAGADEGAAEVEIETGDIAVASTSEPLPRSPEVEADTDELEPDSDSPAPEAKTDPSRAPGQPAKPRSPAHKAKPRMTAWLVESKPKGATVRRVDGGRALGVTPCRIQLERGATVPISIALPGSKPVVRSISALKDGRVTVTFGKKAAEKPGEVRFLPKPGRLAATTKPPTLVRIRGGRLLGRTPLDLEIPAGEYVLLVEEPASGKRRTVLVSIGSGETARLYLDLTR